MELAGLAVLRQGESGAGEPRAAPDGGFDPVESHGESTALWESCRTFTSEAIEVWIPARIALAVK
jgi:hypothetical protein